MQPHPAILCREIAATVPAKEPLELTGHSDSGAGADTAGDLYISLAPLWMILMHHSRQIKEPLHALECQIPDLVAVLSPSHGHD